MVIQQFQTQFYLVHQHFKLKPFFHDNSEVFYALLSFLYRNITFLKQSHTKRKEGRKKEKRKKIKKLCSFKILYCNISQVLNSILQVHSLLVSMNEAPFLMCLPCMYAACTKCCFLQPYWELFTSFIHLQYPHIWNYIYLSLLTFTLFEKHVSFSKKNLLYLVCQTTSAGNHMLLNYGTQDELKT